MVGTPVIVVTSYVLYCRRMSPRDLVLSWLAESDVVFLGYEPRPFRSLAWGVEGNAQLPEVPSSTPSSPDS